MTVREALWKYIKELVEGIVSLSILSYLVCATIVGPVVAIALIIRACAEGPGWLGFVAVGLIFQAYLTGRLWMDVVRGEVD